VTGAVTGEVPISFAEVSKASGAPVIFDKSFILD
jgi:hypothetical protein